MKIIGICRYQNTAVQNKCSFFPIKPTGNHLKTLILHSWSPKNSLYSNIKLYCSKEK